MSHGRPDRMNERNEQGETEPVSTCCGVSVYYSGEHDNFYCSKCNKGQGTEFYLKHRGQEKTNGK